MAFSRGWRIKDTEHIQCGKWRDLGFGSILQDWHKDWGADAVGIITWGHNYSLDRFLTFYYAHPVSPAVYAVNAIHRVNVILCGDMLRQGS